MPIKEATYVRKFWERTSPNIETGCWEWTGTRHPTSGYGRVMRGGQRDRHAHRVAWELSNGSIPAGLSVLHHCDNPPCVNPDHLFLGTQSDNMQDMKNKRRGRGAMALGYSSPRAKIDKETADLIRTEYVAGLSIPVLSAKHSLGIATIGRVIAGKHKWTDHTSVSRTASEAALIRTRTITGKLGR